MLFFFHATPTPTRVTPWQGLKDVFCSLEVYILPSKGGSFRADGGIAIRARNVKLSTQGGSSRNEREERVH